MRITTLAGVRGLQYAPVTQNARPTLIDGFTMAAALKLLKQLLHAPDLIDSRVQFRDLPDRGFFPSRGNRTALAQTEQEFPNLIQTETGFLRRSQHSDSVNARHVIAALPAHSLGERQYAELFVVANGGRPQSNPPRCF